MVTISWPLRNRVSGRSWTIAAATSRPSWSMPVTGWVRRGSSGSGSSRDWRKTGARPFLCGVSSASVRLGQSVRKVPRTQQDRTHLPAKVRRPIPPPPRRGALRRALGWLPGLLPGGTGRLGRAVRGDGAEAAGHRRAVRGERAGQGHGAGVRRGADRDPRQQRRPLRAAGRDLALAGPGGDRDRGPALPSPFRRRPGRPGPRPGRQYAGRGGRGRRQHDHAAAGQEPLSHAGALAAAASCRS